MATNVNTSPTQQNGGRGLANSHQGGRGGGSMEILSGNPS